MSKIFSVLILSKIPIFPVIIIKNESSFWPFFSFLNLERDYIIFIFKYK